MSQHRATAGHQTEDRAQAHLPASDPFLVEPIGCMGIDGGQASGGTAPSTGSRGTWIFFCFSMFALCSQVVRGDAVR